MMRTSATVGRFMRLWLPRLGSAASQNSPQFEAKAIIFTKRHHTEKIRMAKSMLEYRQTIPCHRLELCFWCETPKQGLRISNFQRRSFDAVQDPVKLQDRCLAVVQMNGLASLGHE